MNETPQWPRIRNLPEMDREPFSKWLNEFGQTRPLIEGETDEDQDGYYTHDYKRWRAVLLNEEFTKGYRRCENKHCATKAE